MRQSVKDFFRKYSIEHEGFTPFMYCDTLNLVTTGIGNLIDSSARNSFDTSPAAMQMAMGLPWKFKAPGWTTKNPLASGNASQGDIAASWAATKLHEKENPGFNKQGGFFYAGLTPLTLDMAGIEALVSSKMASNNATLVKQYPNFEQWPADAQMGAMSMSWAMGAMFWPVRGFQKFKDAADRMDFEGMRAACQFKGGGSITDPKSRNHDNDIMFRNADNVVKGGGDFDRLFFPGASAAAGALVPSAVNALSNSGIGKIVPVLPYVGGAAIAGFAAYLGYSFYQDYKRIRR